MDDNIRRDIAEDYDPGDLSELQEFLLAGYYRWAGRRRRSQASERQFATVLGVRPPSWNNWITRGSKPDLMSCIQLSNYYGPQIFELCGYPPVVIAPNDSELFFLVSTWPDLEGHEQQAIVDILNRRHQRGRARGAAIPHSRSERTETDSGSDPMA